MRSAARPACIRRATPAATATATRNIDKLLATLDGVPDAARSAHFLCVLVLLRHADDPQPLIAEGRWQGRILHAPRGSGGFGYDPVFFDRRRTAAARRSCRPT